MGKKKAYLKGLFFCAYFTAEFRATTTAAARSLLRPKLSQMMISVLIHVAPNLRIGHFAKKGVDELIEVFRLHSRVGTYERLPSLFRQKQVTLPLDFECRMGRLIVLHRRGILEDALEGHSAKESPDEKARIGGYALIHLLRTDAVLDHLPRAHLAPLGLSVRG